MNKILIPLALLAATLCGCSKSDDAPAATQGPAVGPSNTPAEALAAQKAGATSAAESRQRAAAVPQAGK